MHNLASALTLRAPLGLQDSHTFAVVITVSRNTDTYYAVGNIINNIRAAMAGDSTSQRQTAVAAYLKSEQLLLFAFAGRPAETRHWINIGLTLVHRLRRRTNVNPTLIHISCLLGGGGGTWACRALGVNSFVCKQNDVAGLSGWCPKSWCVKCGERCPAWDSSRNKKHYFWQGRSLPCRPLRGRGWMYLLYPKNPTWRWLRAIPTPRSEKSP